MRNNPPLFSQKTSGEQETTQIHETITYKHPSSTAIVTAGQRATKFPSAVACPHRPKDVLDADQTITPRGESASDGATEQAPSNSELAVSSSKAASPDAVLKMLKDVDGMINKLPAARGSEGPTDGNLSALEEEVSPVLRHVGIALMSPQPMHGGALFRFSTIATEELPNHCMSGSDGYLTISTRFVMYLRSPFGSEGYLTTTIYFSLCTWPIEFVFFLNQNLKIDLSGGALDKPPQAWSLSDYRCYPLPSHVQHAKQDNHPVGRISGPIFSKKGGQAHTQETDDGFGQIFVPQTRFRLRSPRSLEKISWEKSSEGRLMRYTSYQFGPQYKESFYITISFKPSLYFGTIWYTRSMAASIASMSRD